MAYDFITSIFKKLSEVLKKHINKADKTMIKTIPLKKTKIKPKKRLGFMAKQIKIPKDFDQMKQAEIIKIFNQ